MQQPARRPVNPFRVRSTSLRNKFRVLACFLCAVVCFVLGLALVARSLALNRRFALWYRGSLQPPSAFVLALAQSRNGHSQNQFVYDFADAVDASRSGTAGLMKAVHAAYWSQDLSHHTALLDDEQAPLLYPRRIATFPVRRRALRQSFVDTARLASGMPGPASDPMATAMDATWFADDGWGVASNPNIIAREHYVQERYDRMALIVVDLWDTHWCKTAASRIERLLIPPLNLALREARKRGMLVIHAPTDIVAFLEQRGNAGERRMRDNARRYTTRAKLDALRATTSIVDMAYEAARRTRVLPRPAGCMCSADPHERCEEQYGWSALHPLLDVDPENDVLVADDLVELVAVLEGRGIERVVYVGAHLNLCISSAKRISMYSLNQTWSHVRKTDQSVDGILFARDLVDAFTTYRPAHGRTPDAGLRNVIAFLERDPGGFGSVNLLRDVLALEKDKPKLSIAPWGSLLAPHYFLGGSSVLVTVETSIIGTGDPDIMLAPVHQTISINQSGVYVWREAFGILQTSRLPEIDPSDLVYPGVTAGVYLRLPVSMNSCKYCVELGALLTGGFLREVVALNAGANCSIAKIQERHTSRAAARRSDLDLLEHRPNSGSGSSSSSSSSSVSLPAQCAYRVDIPRDDVSKGELCLCSSWQLRDEVLIRHRRGRLHAARTSAVVTVLDAARGVVIGRTPVLWPRDSRQASDADANHTPWRLCLHTREIRSIWILVQSRSEAELVQRRYSDVVIQHACP